jgi:hypothetical protein
MTTGTPARWFARLGAALEPDEERLIAGLLAAHPRLEGAEVAVVAQWAEAAAIVRGTDWDSTWWDCEEEERERLWLRVADRIGEAALFAQATAHGQALAPVVRDAAAAAAARGGCSDAEAIRAASGAALLAAQQALLAELAGESDAHLFQRKRLLFAMGRWPLGLLHGRYFVF